MVQRLKRLPAVWEIWVQSLSREDPLEKEMATHSSILAWRIPWTEELGGLQSTGRKESGTTERLHVLSFFLRFGRPLQSMRNFPEENLVPQRRTPNQLLFALSISHE